MYKWRKFENLNEMSLSGSFLITSFELNSLKSGLFYMILSQAAGWKALII